MSHPDLAQICTQTILLQDKPGEDSAEYVQVEAWHDGLICLALPEEVDLLGRLSQAVITMTAEEARQLQHALLSAINAAAMEGGDS